MTGITRYSPRFAGQDVGMVRNYGPRIALDPTESPNLPSSTPYSIHSSRSRRFKPYTPDVLTDRRLPPALIFQVSYEATVGIPRNSPIVFVRPGWMNLEFSPAGRSRPSASTRSPISPSRSTLSALAVLRIPPNEHPPPLGDTPPSVLYRFRMERLPESPGTHQSLPVSCGGVDWTSDSQLTTRYGSTTSARSLLPSPTRSFLRTFATLKISPKKRRQSLNRIPSSMSRKSCTKRPPESPAIVRCLRLAWMRVFGASARHLLWIRRIRPIPLPLPRPIPPVLKTPQKSSPKCPPQLNNLQASLPCEFHAK